MVGRRRNSNFGRHEQRGRSTCRPFVEVESAPRPRRPTRGDATAAAAAAPLFQAEPKQPPSRTRPSQVLAGDGDCPGRTDGGLTPFAPTLAQTPRTCNGGWCPAPQSCGCGSAASLPASGQGFVEAAAAAVTQQPHSSFEAKRVGLPRKKPLHGL